MCFEIYDKSDRPNGLITLHGAPDIDGDCFKVTCAPISAWRNCTEDNYTSRVYFHRTHASWKAAFRVARLLAQCTPRLRAVIDQKDLLACARFELSAFAHVTLPMMLVPTKEVA